MNVDAVRERFSSLQKGFAFFDAPGGTQVPDEVGQAIANALREASGNLGAPYATGRAVEAILERAKADAARFLGCTADEISFGMNMTTLDFAISRAAGRDFAGGRRGAHDRARSRRRRRAVGRARGRQGDDACGSPA